ncbi:MAG: betaine--homocysteine S-methyltransferase [Acidimicrobiia bacterium]
MSIISSPNPIATLLEEKGRLVADGGMGTSLFELGLQAGSTPEIWNVDHPERVAKVHQGFVDAGADIILTNTFGGTRARLDLDGLGDRVEELNRAGVAIALEVAEAADRPVIVAGSVGPTGQLFEPMGPLTHDRAVEIFAEQVSALTDAGAQVIWIETLSSTEELAPAAEAARGSGLPVVTTMSFDTHGNTMMGVPPSSLAHWWSEQSEQPAAVGANCGIGPADVVAAAAEIHQTDPNLVVIAKGNCGIPEVIDGNLWYPTSSDDMTAYAQLALDAGARILGACCGSVPAHIAQIRAVVDEYEPGPFALENVESRLGKVSKRGPARERRRRRR